MSLFHFVARMSLKARTTALQTEKPATSCLQEDFEAGQRYECDKSFSLAITSYEATARRGHVKAQVRLAWLYWLTGKGCPSEEAKAVVWFQRAALNDDAMAQLCLGAFFENGRGGLVRDATTAATWYRLAATRAHCPVAQNSLAMLYLRGQGVKQSDAMAARLLGHAAKSGFAAAQHNLADLFARGRGVERDAAAAFKWYLCAARQGYAVSQVSVALCFTQGAGCCVDKQSAVHWYRKAAEQGLKEAQERMAKCYEQGFGVCIDHEEAERWRQEVLSSTRTLESDASEDLFEYLKKRNGYN